jgi:hypothetical protein
MLPGSLLQLHAALDIIQKLYKCDLKALPSELRPSTASPRMPKVGANHKIRGQELEKKGYDLQCLEGKCVCANQREFIFAYRDIWAVPRGL